MSWVLDIVMWILNAIAAYAMENPGKTLIFVVVVGRTFGTTVQTGWKGVLFSFGRAKRELEPGFTPLIPFVQKVRKVPIRAITLHLPMQRITTADGLVYDVQANLVYRIVEPMRTLVVIDDIRKGCEAVLPVIIQDLLRARTRGELQERGTLDAEFTARAAESLQHWGATVEQAGFMTIAPTSKTLRLTQLGQLTRERERMLQIFRDAGLSPELAVALLGSDRTVIGHSSARYRARSQQVALFLKSFLAQERQRRIQALVALGMAREEALAQVAADRSWHLETLVAARMANRRSASRRRPHGVATTIALVESSV